MSRVYSVSSRRRRRQRRNPLVGPAILLALLLAALVGFFGVRGPLAGSLVEAPTAVPQATAAPTASPASALPTSLPTAVAASAPSAVAATSPLPVPDRAVPSASPSPVASSAGMAADWLRTVRDTPLWSGPSGAAEQFTTLPGGSFVLPRGGSETGRLLVYYPGDGQTRKAGTAWLAAQDVAPSGPPPWVLNSEVDGERAGTPQPSNAPKRTTYVAPPPVTAKQLAVVDDATGLMLYGLSAHAPQPPASTTKIVTATVALQHASSLSTLIPITVNGWGMAQADGSSIMGLSPGQQVSVRTLLYGLLLPSGNDAAEQLARSLADSREQYVAWMNGVVADLGLHDTQFVNPSGLDEDGHYASPYDMAQLARTAMRNDTFRTIVAAPTYAADGFKLEGHNPLLGVYRGADGVKTGTTDAAGHAIVASVTRNGHRVYVVVMHSDDLLSDCTALYDWVWQSFSW